MTPKLLIISLFYIIFSAITENHEDFLFLYHIKMRAAMKLFQITWNNMNMILCLSPCGESGELHLDLACISFNY